MLNDIILAAFLAFIITWVLKFVIRMYLAVHTRSTELLYRPRDVERVLVRCYNLFPIENMRFNGETFRRGMVVRVVTNRNKTIEGEFLGANDENMVCFLTPRSVIAHEINNIEEMSEVVS